MVIIRFTVYLSPTMSVAFAIVEGIFRAQPSLPVVGVPVGAAAAVSMGGVVVVAAFLCLALATGMGGVDTVGPAILVEVAPSALGFWSFFLGVHLLAESVDFLQDGGHNMGAAPRWVAVSVLSSVAGVAILHWMVWKLCSMVAYMLSCTWAISSRTVVMSSLVTSVAWLAFFRRLRVAVAWRWRSCSL